MSKLPFWKKKPYEFIQGILRRTAKNYLEKIYLLDALKLEVYEVLENYDNGKINLYNLLKKLDYWAEFLNTDFNYPKYNEDDEFEREGGDPYIFVERIIDASEELREILKNKANKSINKMFKNEQKYDFVDRNAANALDLHIMLDYAVTDFDDEIISDEHLLNRMKQSRKRLNRGNDSSPVDLKIIKFDYTNDFKLDRLEGRIESLKEGLPSREEILEQEDREKKERENRQLQRYTREIKKRNKGIYREFKKKRRDKIRELREEKNNMLRIIRKELEKPPEESQNLKYLLEELESVQNRIDNLPVVVSSSNINNINNIERQNVEQEDNGNPPSYAEFIRGPKRGPNEEIKEGEIDLDSESEPEEEREYNFPPDVDEPLVTLSKGKIPSAVEYNFTSPLVFEPWYEGAIKAVDEEEEEGAINVEGGEQEEIKEGEKEERRQREIEEAEVEGVMEEMLDIVDFNFNNPY
jgi:hypothetical protein